MDEGSDNRSRSDRRRPHRTIEDRLPHRHDRPAEEEHARLPRRAGADSAEGFSVGAVSVAACQAARSDRSAQAPDYRQTGTDATTDSGAKERTAAPAAAPSTADLARDRAGGNQLDRLSGSVERGHQP